jgi:hypothetical protein
VLADVDGVGLHTVATTIGCRSSDNLGASKIQVKIAVSLML